MKTVSKILALLICSSTLLADTLTVTVRCSNGNRIANLPISVYDATGFEVPGISRTDSGGDFVIQNSQNYQAPYNLFFTAYDGSTCGAYNVIQSTPDEGFVYLNYYPVDLPCSCSLYGPCQGGTP